MRFVSDRAMRDAYDYEFLFGEFLEVLYNLDVLDGKHKFDLLVIHDMMHKYVSPVIWL